MSKRCSLYSPIVVDDQFIELLEREFEAMGCAEEVVASPSPAPPTPGADGVAADDALTQQTVREKLETDPKGKLTDVDQLVSTEELREVLETPQPTTEGQKSTVGKFEKRLNDAAKEQTIEEELPAAKPGMEGKVDQLRDAAKAGDVGPRTSLGQRFAAFLKADGESRQKYKSLNTPGCSREEKRLFRMAWAKEELRKSTVVRSKGSSHVLVDQEKAQYMSLDMVIKHEGGRHSPSAVKAGMTYQPYQATITC